MADYTQDQRNVSVTTPLGKDKLLFRALAGEEALSEPFRFELDLAASEGAIAFDDIVGQPATVAFELSSGGTRYLNGVVARFAQVGSDQRFTHYRAVLRPWLWQLSQQRGCKIFQQQTVVEIVTSVFDDLGFQDYRNATTGSYAPRVFCVQYRESAFAFVSRLMEEEGIFYFHEHVDGVHTLVLADDADAHADTPEIATLSYRPGALIDREVDDRVSSLSLERQLVPGAYASDDYNFESPATELYVSAEGAGEGQAVYEYPGLYAKTERGQSLAKLRMEALEAPATVLHAEGSARSLVSGFKVTLQDHPRADVNQAYVVTRVRHRADTERYQAEFEAIPSSVPFRPPLITPKPRIHGSQTAKVVGKSGEEIWTDEYGRIKVQFPWDQDGESDENASCWIRVAQLWAGASWGAWWLPRIGQEVVVTFLEGDPDRPLVTGTVYNGDNTLPYDMPGEQTKSTIKSNSSKGGDGFNELRFEDAAGSEEIYVHAQKDLVTDVENDRTTTVIAGNDTLSVQEGDRTVDVTAGNETHSVGGTRDLTVTGDETRTNEANFTQTVAGDYSLTVDGNLTIEVAGDVTIKADGAVTIKAGGDVTIEAGGAWSSESGTSYSAKSGTEMTNEAGTSLTNKGGVSLSDEAPNVTVKSDANTTVQAGAICAVKGSMVQIN
jgi:type VI secretion system secreted protein VgrG